jgi:3-dehydroquinate synthase
MRVALGERSYDILVGEGLLATAGRLMAPFVERKRVAIITDENVAGLHLAAVERSLDTEGIAYEALVLPPGEKTKDFGHLESLVDRLLEAKVERTTPLVALGGGVVGDLTGFAASIVLRGLDFIQVPTTLLAQVDSSVGGKTGINTEWGKNLVGSFHQPRLVLADTESLSTLPPRELLAGYAELVKYGLINDPDLFGWLESHGATVIDGDPMARRRAVLASCANKAALVAEDEREAGRRALLNLGHTFAHALEAEFGYGDYLLHGEAVAIGLCLAFDLSTRLGLCPPEHAARVRRHLAAVGLPTGLETLDGQALSAGALLDHMSRDKKVQDGKVTFVLVRGIGEAFLSRDVNLADVEALLNSALAA